MFCPTVRAVLAGSVQGVVVQARMRMSLVSYAFLEHIANCVISPLYLELRHHGRVLHVVVGAGLVQLVRRKAGAGRRRVRLNGVAFVEQALVVELFEQVPSSSRCTWSRR